MTVLAAVSMSIGWLMGSKKKQASFAVSSIRSKIISCLRTRDFSSPSHRITLLELESLQDVLSHKQYYKVASMFEEYIVLLRLSEYKTEQQKGFRSHCGQPYQQLLKNSLCQIYRQLN